MLLALTAAVGGDFTKTLTPEKIRASGLAKLTSEELTELETLVEQYKAGALVAAAAVVPTSTAVQPGTPAAKPADKHPAWFSALVTSGKTKSPPDQTDVMESRLAGDFKGWNGRTTFRLENGQVWRQTDHDRYDNAPLLKSPKVKLYPASFGTYWLEIDGAYQRCRVLPVKLP